MRVLVTRARRQAERTAARLRALGADPMVAPVVEVIAADAPSLRDGVDALLATSANAFLAFGREAPDPRLAQLPLFTVGARTAAAARSFGFGDVRSADGDAASLAALIAAERPGRMLYLAGRNRKPDIEAALEAMNLQVLIVVTYEVRPAERLDQEAEQALRTGAIDAVLHYSRRSATIFFDLASERGGTEAMLVPLQACISDDVAAACRDAGARRVVVADRPDETALLAALLHAKGAAPG